MYVSWDDLLLWNQISNLRPLSPTSLSFHSVLSERYKTICCLLQTEQTNFYMSYISTERVQHLDFLVMNLQVLPAGDLFSEESAVCVCLVWFPSKECRDTAVLLLEDSMHPLAIRGLKWIQLNWVYNTGGSSWITIQLLPVEDTPAVITCARWTPVTVLILGLQQFKHALKLSVCISILAIHKQQWTCLYSQSKWLQIRISYIHPSLSKW